MELQLEDICQYEPLARLDAQENLFFQRELEHIIPELFEFEHARITARSFFPIDTSAGPGAETITYRQFTKTGVAKIISDYANDIPTANAFGEELTGRIRSSAIAAKWSIQEIRAAKMAGRALDRMQAEASREALMRLENNIAFSGDASHGLIGLFTDPNIPIGPVGGAVWSGATPAKILADMDAFVSAIPQTTGDVEAPDTLALPIAQFDLIHSLNAALGTDSTVAKYFLANNPYIKTLTRHRELAGAGPGSTDTMVIYEKSIRKLRLNVPLDIEQLAPQARGLCVWVPYHMRMGGVTVTKPLSINIGHGI